MPLLHDLGDRRQRLGEIGVHLIDERGDFAAIPVQRSVALKDFAVRLLVAVTTLVSKGAKGPYSDKIAAVGLTHEHREEVLKGVAGCAPQLEFEGHSPVIALLGRHSGSTAQSGM